MGVRVLIVNILLENYNALLKKEIENLFQRSHYLVYLQTVTAWSNDFSFETFFKRQVEAHGKNGDILFLISTGGGNEKSGASMSLVEAAIEAKKKFKNNCSNWEIGGLLKDLADISIVVKSDITSHIQESHIALLHCICEKLEAN